MIRENIYMNLDEIFKTQVDAFETRASAKFIKDPRMLNIEVGKTYRFRLLAFASDVRKDLFINKWVHHNADYSDKNVNVDYEYVTCPCSEYIDNHSYNCPICESISSLYKQGKAGNLTAKKMSNRFKRIFNGFIPVYVIADPTTPENVGHVKIWKFSKEVNVYLKKKIFGIDISKKKDDKAPAPAIMNTVGKRAFMLDNGLDIIMSVTEKTDGEFSFRNYACEFALEPTTITTPAENLLSEYNALNFDKDFYTKSSEKELLEFKGKYIITPSEPSISSPREVKSSTVITSDVLIGGDTVKNAAVTYEPTKPAESKSSQTSTMNDVDLDDLLKDIGNIK